jgi:nucleolar protein 6
MKTCLKLMHHSTFDDGKSAPRKINVELTYVPFYKSHLNFFFAQLLFERRLISIDSAGGGGNTVERKSKIEAKNAKLNEERIRKIHEEEKAKLEKAAADDKNGNAAIDESAIHPSRRGRVPVMT